MDHHASSYCYATTVHPRMIRSSDKGALSSSSLQTPSSKLEIPMASIFLRFISHGNPLLLHHNQPSQASNPLLHIHHLPTPKPFTVDCTTPPSANAHPPDFPSPYPNSDTTNSAETFPIEKRRKSEIIRDRKARTKLEKPEPPNFEVGWKRSKVIKLEKPKGYVIADFLEKLEELMGREFGSSELLAKTGEIVADRAREEAEVLRDEGEVDERLVTELFRVLRLMEMDLAMVKAAVKEETLSERLEQAKARCRQAILVANSF